MAFSSVTKNLETELYFVIFFLFGSFLALLIHNTSLDTIMFFDYINGQQSRSPLSAHTRAVKAALDDEAPRN